MTDVHALAERIARRDNLPAEAARAAAIGAFAAAFDPWIDRPPTLREARCDLIDALRDRCHALAPDTFPRPGRWPGADVALARLATHEPLGLELLGRLDASALRGLAIAEALDHFRGPLAARVVSLCRRRGELVAEVDVFDRRRRVIGRYVVARAPGDSRV